MGCFVTVIAKSCVTKQGYSPNALSPRMQLLAVLTQRAILPGKLVGCILHWFPQCARKDPRTFSISLLPAPIGSPRPLLPCRLIFCACVHVTPLPSAALSSRRSRLPAERMMLGLPPSLALSQRTATLGSPLRKVGASPARMPLRSSVRSGRAGFRNSAPGCLLHGHPDCEYAIAQMD